MRLQLDASEAELLASCIGRRIVQILIPMHELDELVVEASAAIVRFDTGSALTLGSERISEFKRGEADVLRLYVASGEQVPLRWPGGPPHEIGIASPLEPCFGHEVVDVKLAPSTQDGSDDAKSDLLEVDGGLFLFFATGNALEFDVVSTMPEAIGLKLRDTSYLTGRRDLVPLVTRRMRILRP